MAQTQSNKTKRKYTKKSERIKQTFDEMNSILSNSTYAKSTDTTEELKPQYKTSKGDEVFTIYSPKGQFTISIQDNTLPRGYEPDYKDECKECPNCTNPSVDGIDITNPSMPDIILRASDFDYDRTALIEHTRYYTSLDGYEIIESPEEMEYDVYTNEQRIPVLTDQGRLVLVDTSREDTLSFSHNLLVSRAVNYTDRVKEEFMTLLNECMTTEDPETFFRIISDELFLRARAIVNERIVKGNYYDSLLMPIEFTHSDPNQSKPD